MRNYILNPSDFTFSPFHDGRKGIGSSGHLLQATNKKTGAKLLVKHEQASDIPCEFVAGYIEEQLGFYGPKVYLFKPCSQFKYAVGIEFMEGLEKFDPALLSEDQEAELIHQVSLNDLIFNEDKMQMNLWNGHVVFYDFSKSFSAEFLRFPSDYSLASHLDRYSDDLLYMPDTAMRIMKKSPSDAEQIEKIYYTGLLPLLEINRDDLFDILLEILPGNIAGYYDACVGIMVDKTKQELQEKGYL